MPLLEYGAHGFSVLYYLLYSVECGPEFRDRGVALFDPCWTAQILILVHPALAFATSDELVFNRFNQFLNPLQEESFSLPLWKDPLQAVCWVWRVYVWSSPILVRDLQQALKNLLFHGLIAPVEVMYSWMLRTTQGLLEYFRNHLGGVCYSTFSWPLPSSSASNNGPYSCICFPAWPNSASHAFRPQYGLSHRGRIFLSDLPYSFVHLPGVNKDYCDLEKKVSGLE